MSDTFRFNSYHCAAGDVVVRPQIIRDHLRVMHLVAPYEPMRTHMDPYGPTWTHTDLYFRNMTVNVLVCANILLQCYMVRIYILHLQEHSCFVKIHIKICI
jgi:hypothetical protein